MIVLAIDTAGPSLSVALLQDHAVTSELFINTGANHSFHLLPAIKHVYDVAGKSAGETDLFVCTSGPGSFTGLRIGVSTIKGLAMAAGRPVVGLSTLEALAANMNCVSKIICPMVDAQRNQVYAATYKIGRNFNSEMISEDMLTDLESYLSNLKDKENTIFLGSGALKYADKIISMIPNSFIATSDFSYVRASLVAALGMRKFYEGCLTDPLNLMPKYLRLAEAERKHLASQ